MNQLYEVSWPPGGGGDSSVVDANYPPNQLLGGSVGGGVEVGDLGWERGGGGGAPLTSTCPPSNHSITINRTLTFAANWFGHASHVDWAEQDPKISFMAAFATSLLSIADPHDNCDPSLGRELGLGLGLGLASPSWWNQSWFYNSL